MFGFLKRFQKECVDTCEKLEEPKPIRRVVDGFLYDTSKSEKICEYCVKNEDMSVREMMFGPCCFAILFRSRNGRFFIQQYGRLYPCDERITKNILQYETDKYQEIFGKVEDA